MLTPSTAELLNAIEVLNKLGERINTDANHSVMQMPESSLGEHYAGRIGVNAIEQTSRIQIVASSSKTGATNYCNNGAKCFSIRLIQKKLTLRERRMWRKPRCNAKRRQMQTFVRTSCFV